MIIVFMVADVCLFPVLLCAFPRSTPGHRAEPDRRATGAGMPRRALRPVATGRRKPAALGVESRGDCGLLRTLGRRQTAGRHVSTEARGRAVVDGAHRAQGRRHRRARLGVLRRPPRRRPPSTSCPPRGTTPVRSLPPPSRPGTPARRAREGPRDTAHGRPLLGRSLRLSTPHRRTGARATPTAAAARHRPPPG